MIKYFCNRCEKPLENDKGQPYTRFDRQTNRMATVLIMVGGQGESEICHACIQDIVINGTPTPLLPSDATAPPPPVAPLQPQPPQPPEQAEEPIFEPSTVTPS